MTKRYITATSDITLYFNVNKFPVKVTFQSCREGGFFITSDKNLQKAMESSSLFNKMYSVASEMEELKPNISKNDTMDIVNVKNINQAKDYLVSLGIPSDSIRNINDIKKYAAEKKVSFSNIEIWGIKL